MRTACIFLLLLTAGMATHLFADSAITTRKTNCVREGPGAYYPLVAMLPENTKLDIAERGAQWTKVQLPQKKSGWIATNCLVGKPAANTRTMDVANVWSSPKASRAGVSAAIKGFARKYGKTDPGDVDLLLKYKDKTFTQSELSAFTAGLRSPAGSGRKSLSLEDLDVTRTEYDPSFTEQEIGAGIGARVVARGLVTNERLRTYVNMIAAALAQASNVYDWDFTVYVLKDRKVNAFAAPGGYLFLTQGALELCADESELAAMIAHEIGHIVLRHGLGEMMQRRVTIKADEAFAELDEETGGNDPDTEELETMVEQTYDKIVARRLAEYELDADKISALLCANAGYDPSGLLRISEKTMLVTTRATDIFDPDYMAPDTARKRYEAARTLLAGQRDGRDTGARMTERFRAHTGLR